ncbi:MAG: PEP-CTERM sorting domain-containing protein [Akkermansiaceae bacterium]|nr:PEP-CTERM sorting domain-containing protein [Akkermansiaceae bacterium]
MKIPTTHFLAACFSTLGILGSQSASAATVAWSGPTSIGDGTTTLVIDSGHTLFATNKAGNIADQTVNGIFFENDSQITLWGSNFNAAGGDLPNAGRYSAGATTAINDLLSSNNYKFNAAGTDIINIDLSGLTIGLEYIAKFYFTDGARTPDRDYFLTSGGVESTHFNAEDSVLMTATFTADATTQEFDLGGNDYPRLAAILVTEAVPEPSAALLGGLGLITMLLQRRRA